MERRNRIRTGMWRGSKLALPRLLSAVLISLGSLCLAQNPSGPTWVSLDGSAPGTPPDVVQDIQASNLQATVFQVDIHGFYREDVVAAGQTFQRITVPRMGGINAVGKPEVPALPVLVGIPSSAAAVAVSTTQVLASQTIQGVRVHPAQIHQADSPQLPPAPPFQLDATAYGNSALYPSVLAKTGAAPGTWKGVRVHQCYVQPFQVNAATNTLIVRRSLRVTFSHQGTQITPRTITRRSYRMLASAISNFAALAGLGFVQPNDFTYDGYYLIITDALFLEEVAPLADQKRELGFKVTVLTTADIGGSSETYLRAAVSNWFNTGTPGWFHDSYVLLVGDTDRVGICLDPEYGLASDYYLGSIDGDIYAEVGVGRLSVDSEADCSAQIAKILEYQDAPTALPNYYDNVLLAASTDDSGDARFFESCEEIASNPWYMYNLAFAKRYGDWTSGTVANALDDIDAGQSVVVYEGHGSYWRWASWDANDDDLTATDVAGLANAHVMPVVLALCCQNSNTDSVDDCIGEEWMEKTPGGAVAHVGATRNAWICHYTLFGPSFFRQLYGDATPTMTELLQAAQFDAYGLNSAENDEHSRKTIWQFQLLGDPAMKIWQKTPENATFDYVHIAAGSAGAGILEGVVRDRFGLPIGGAIVSVHKPGEIEINRYTGADGAFQIPLPPHTAGTATLRISTDFDAVKNVRLVVTLPSCVGCAVTPSVALSQPGGPGTGLTVTNSNLVPGREYYNLFSPNPCAGGAGTGPWLGLCVDDFDTLLAQFLMPVGILPFHSTATSATTVMGPFALPPMTLDVVCFEFTGGTLGGISPVVRKVVQ